MKRFLFGTAFGVLSLVAVFTLMPDRAHRLIDQAHDVRSLIEDMTYRIDQLEEESHIELQNESPSEKMGGIEIETLISGIQNGDVAETMPQESEFDSSYEHSTSFQAQAVNFDELRNGLAKVTGALERLNKTMQPGSKIGRKKESVDNRKSAPGS